MHLCNRVCNHITHPPHAFRHNFDLCCCLGTGQFTGCVLQELKWRSDEHLQRVVSELESALTGRQQAELEAKVAIGQAEAEVRSAHSMAEAAKVELSTAQAQVGGNGVKGSGCVICREAWMGDMCLYLCANAFRHVVDVVIV